MDDNNLKVVIVMPAYNAEKTLEKTLKDIPQGSFSEIILVDDGSSDRTVEVARNLGLQVVQHEKNKGYGANQKTCYKAALEHGAGIVVMLHPDYQYDARLVSYMVGFIKDGVCDVMLGNRIRTRREVLSCGMPLYKYFFNRLLTIIENVFLGQNLSEYHTGFRAYSHEVLEKIPFENNNNGFVFDSQFLVQAVFFKFRIGEVPVPVRYFKEASSIDFLNSFIYGLKTLWVLVEYKLHKMGVLKSKLFSK